MQTDNLARKVAKNNRQKEKTKRKRAAFNKLKRITLEPYDQGAADKCIKEKQAVNEKMGILHQQMRLANAGIGHIAFLRNKYPGLPAPPMGANFGGYNAFSNQMPPVYNGTAQYGCGGYTPLQASGGYSSLTQPGSIPATGAVVAHSSSPYPNVQNGFGAMNTTMVSSTGAGYMVQQYSAQSTAVQHGQTTENKLFASSTRGYHPQPVPIHAPSMQYSYGTENKPFYPSDSRSYHSQQCPGPPVHLQNGYGNENVPIYHPSGEKYVTQQQMVALKAQVNGFAGINKSFLPPASSSYPTQQYSASYNNYQHSYVDENDPVYHPESEQYFAQQQPVLIEGAQHGYNARNKPLPPAIGSSFFTQDYLGPERIAEDNNSKYQQTKALSAVGTHARLQPIPEETSSNANITELTDITNHDDMLTNLEGVDEIADDNLLSDVLDSNVEDLVKTIDFEQLDRFLNSNNNVLHGEEIDCILNEIPVHDLE